MKWVPIDPEVYFAIGKGTIFEKGKEWKLDYTKILNVEIEYYDETPIMCNFPFYVIDENFKNVLIKNGCTGFELSEAIVTFDEDHPNRVMFDNLPRFYWMKIVGKSNKSDFYEKKFGNEIKVDYLMISEKISQILKDIDNEYYELIRDSANRSIKDRENN